MSTLPKIIAVDFDGTLFENAWPDVGAPIEKNINKLKAEQADGAKVILWTNRVGGALDKAVNFCKEHGIHLDAVYSSPLKRAYHTAEAVNRYHRLPIHTDGRLMEINGGHWEEKPWEALPELFTAL